MQPKFIPARFRLPPEFEDQTIYDGFRVDGVGFAYFGFTELEAMLVAHERQIHNWDWVMAGPGFIDWNTFNDHAVGFAAVGVDMPDIKTLYTAGNLIAFEVVTSEAISDLYAWQANIRVAQQKMLKAEEEKQAEAKRAQAAKDVEQGELLARVLSRIFLYPIPAQPTNLWVSPDGFHFSIDPGSFKEGNYRETDILCWWFKLTISKPLPPEIEKATRGDEYYWGETAFDTQTFNGVPVNTEDGDMVETRIRVANIIDFVDQRWHQIVNQITARYPQAASSPEVSAPAPTPAEALAAALYDFVRDAVERIGPVEY